MYSRRDFGKIALASLPVAHGLATINSKFGGVQIGAITYSFRGMPGLDEIIPAMVKIGLGEAELMSNHAEAAAGAPATGGPGGRGAGRGPGGTPAPVPGGSLPTPGSTAETQPPAAGPGGQGRGRGGGRGPMTPEQQAAQRARVEELRKWRLAVSMDKFKDVRKRFEQAGIKVQILCFNMNGSITDEEIEYAFHMAKALDVKGISSTTQVTVAKRVAPFADKYKIMFGGHGHSNLTDPNEFATPESFATAMSYGKYMGANLDIGHFTAANFDAVAYIKEHHARITNLHLKDRKKNQGPNVPWGEGDTPIKEVLQLLKKEKYSFPANIEYEYPGKEDVVTEVGKCLQYCKEALA